MLHATTVMNRFIADSFPQGTRYPRPAGAGDLEVVAGYLSTGKRVHARLAVCKATIKLGENSA